MEDLRCSPPPIVADDFQVVVHDRLNLLLPIPRQRTVGVLPFRREQSEMLTALRYDPDFLQPITNTPPREERAALGGDFLFELIAVVSLASVIESVFALGILPNAERI